MKQEIEVQSFFKDCHPEEIQHYPREVLRLMEPEGFNEFVQHIYHHSGIVETKAYEKAEEVYEEFYGKRRYEDYNSYKSSFHQIKTREYKKRHAEAQPLFDGVLMPVYK